MELGGGSDRKEDLAFAVTVDGAFNGLPWKKRAFYADWKLGDALKGGGIG